MESCPRRREKRQNRQNQFARFRGANPPNPAVRDYFDGASSPANPPGSAFFTGDHFTLFRSDLSKNGAEYLALAEYPLG